MAGTCRAGATGPSELETTHENETPPDDELKEEHEVVEGAKGLKHGYSIVRESMDGDVSRL
jgi:hypothetical protein